MENLLLFNYLVGTATLAMQIGLVGLIVLYFIRPDFLERLLVRWSLRIGFIIAVAGTILTLVYSEYFGIIPCGLCWFGRIFLYPQVILFGIAAYKRDMGIALYSVVLSVCGLIVGLYTHYLQMGGDGLLPCPASGVSDCAKRYLFEYGYITLPLSGATVFAVLIVMMLVVLRANRKGVV